MCRNRTARGDPNPTAVGKTFGGLLAPCRLIPTRPSSIALLALLLCGASARADPKRDVPDYDGRGNPDSESGSWALWIPRVVLYPLYVTNEYVLRRPIGALVRRAERDHWADTIASLFTFGPNGKNVIYPTALFDFGLLPSVGVYYAGTDFAVTNNALRLHFATWGLPWLAATAADRYVIDADDTVEVRFDFKRSQDNLFFGIGSEVRDGTQSRYGLERLETSASWRRRLFGESRIRIDGGVHRLSFNDGTCCGDPTVAQQVAAGVFDEPPGFGETYAAAFAKLDLQLDTRMPRPAPGSGAYLHAYVRPNFDLHENRSWLHYGGEIGEAVDLTGHQRVLQMQLALGFVDQLAGSTIPFTEYQVLGGELMPGFVPGWLTDRSSAAAQLGYRWPIWSGFDAQTRWTIGNAFDAHLEGLRPGRLRMSWDLGITTSAARDQGFEVLFGLGTETIDQGAGITSYRVAFGSRQGF